MMPTAKSGPSEPLAEFEERTYLKVTLRLLPFLALCYLVAYIDRVNVGFAKLQMLSDLGLSETVYGFGAGVFFIGYMLFEVPSNLIMHRVGARRWIARIMITWGIISGAMAFMSSMAAALGFENSTMTFYVLRFLLGVAEAGFFPGIILYFNYWYPSHRQGRIMSLMMAAQPVSFIVGGPLSGFLMDRFHGVHGFQGWQWMYVIEAAPAVLLGILVLALLSNGIDDARWLSPREKTLLKANLEQEKRQKSDYPLGRLFRTPVLWLFVAIYFLLVVGTYGVNFWLPSIIKSTGVSSNLEVGLITAIPYAVAAVVMIATARHAERTNEKRWHTAIAAILGGIGLILSATVTGSVVLTVAFITVAVAGYMTAMAIFWSFPGSMLTGAAVAAGVAAINSLGSMGGFFGPYLLGWLTDRLGNSNAGLMALGGGLVLAGLLVAATCGNYGLRREDDAESGEMKGSALLTE
ncbi:MFS transporter [Azospirillum picis]|uniref:MFS family permease n=1 Tax=Azospirillum picis TaxID=488438 RepID=A0ABU0MMU2_9PROT|nr:MFS transporter [Azospirillum picis]MBP2303588.1 MFS family permease [Azospirillum picis]MDQ0534785.1 MFS family permease [Azospirillum picis]